MSKHKPILPRGAYSPRYRVAINQFDDTMTKQAFAEECDINCIMDRYIKTGVVDHINEHSPQYGDCPAQTFHEALETVREAEQMFDDLPAKIREKFNHNPAEFLAFVEDPANRTEMALLGLLNEPATVVPGAVENTPTASTEATA